MRAVAAALVLLAAGLFAATPAFESVPVAHACSCTDCDAFRDSPVVIRGTVLGWDFVRDTAGAPVERVVDETAYSNPDHIPRRRPIVMTTLVGQVYRGSVGEVVLIAEDLYDRYLRAEGSPPFPGWTWPGTAGRCFAIASDPTGLDLMMALEPAGEPGRYRIVALPFPIDDGSGRTFEERFPSLGSPYPPSVGDSPPAGADSASNDWMFLSAIGAGCLLITLVLLIAGPGREPRDDSPPNPPRGTPRD